MFRVRGLSCGLRIAGCRLRFRLPAGSGSVARMGEHRLEGGFDGGATSVEGTVRRVAGPWSASVQKLLAHLRDRGFDGAPLPLGVDEFGRDVVSYMPGETVGSCRPWPAWTHSDEALVQAAGWLRRFHEAISDFEPGVDAVWREGGIWRPGLIIGHNDAAPYNAVWGDVGLVGFVDWDMTGPLALESDVAWMAFSWVPLHARDVVEAEGFTHFGDRRRRLELFLGQYGGDLTADGLLEVLRRRLRENIDAMRETARSGDPTYQRMLDHGVDLGLVRAIEGLDEVKLRRAVNGERPGRPVSDRRLGTSCQTPGTTRSNDCRGQIAVK